ncbi:hypothetical protein [Arcobacter roscoffensis]|uniref:Uncharacterized protein n=1 Tax=Arcobacter roscoffensis TaxID=2961520 RepID=A0ABY5DZB5_9BACT|nr:hypothetical protein [Arcobacter roscoffensis]UTJ05282.1 hypothetical protein NJU99_08365 [Arcobacter roscoffensis]
MNSVIALEELIKEEESRAALLQKQLANHESGENRLSRLALASTESSLEETQEKLTKHKVMYEELMKQDLKELEEKEKLEEAIRRKKYFDNQNLRVKNNNEKADDQKLEAMMILDELPEEVNFEDDELFEIAQKSLELNLKDHKELKDELSIIRKDFKSHLKNCKEEKLSEIELLNFRIPILVLHFSVLLKNIENNFVPKDDEEEKEKPKKFTGFPRYEDWWIQELWSSHQAYFALFKFKAIIMNVCKTGEQKRSWSKIFDNWVFVKKVLTDKGALAHDYHFALDALLHKYAKLDEELESKNLESMETIIKKITKKEDFTKMARNHSLITPYLKFKKEKLNSLK